MLNNVSNALNVHITFLKSRLAHLVAKYGAKNIFDLTNSSAKFESEEEKLFANGLHHKLDAFTTIANVIGTEPTKISDIPLDEGQELTGLEKSMVAFNAYARMFDDGMAPENQANFDWDYLDKTDIQTIQHLIQVDSQRGDFKAAGFLVMYLWYQENVEKTNTTGTKAKETPVLV
ncbi:hypothetical protein D3C87_460340 [compost metagenome]